MQPFSAKFISDRYLEINCGALSQADCIALFKWLGNQSFGQLPEGQWVLADGKIAYILSRGLTSLAAITDIEQLLNTKLQGFCPSNDCCANGVMHTLKVCWGGDEGPDLPAVAQQVGLEPKALIEALSKLELSVAFNGFLPGFAYLVGLPERFHLPRRDTPRTHVKAGSVAIAGGYAAIYPQASPGGWHILGRCDLPLFDTSMDQPACLLRPGDRVRFVA